MKYICIIELGELHPFLTIGCKNVFAIHVPVKIVIHYKILFEEESLLRYDVGHCGLTFDRPHHGRLENINYVGYNCIHVEITLNELYI